MHRRIQQSYLTWRDGRALPGRDQAPPSNAHAVENAGDLPPVAADRIFASSQKPKATPTRPPVDPLTVDPAKPPLT